jgi:hypothetical protein
MPSNHGLGSDDRQCISKVRKKSIKSDEYQPVEGIEAEPLGRSAPEDDDLLTQGQILGFKRRS